MHSDEQIDRLKLQSQEKPLTRRAFMRVLTLAGAAGPGLMATGLSGFALTRTQRVEAMEMIVDGMGKLPHVDLGKRLGHMKIAPICISQDWNRDLMGPAIEMGINFIHKAGYWGGNVPDEIKKLPRESYYTDITVDTTSPGHDPDNFDQAYNQVVNSLDRNGLQYYDIYRAHYGWHTPDKVKAENNTSYKAFLKLKKEGKVKYFGVSQHPYVDQSNAEKRDEYAQIINAIIDSGIVDSMQVWFSYGYAKETQDVFAKASKAGIAMTAMKINAHGRGKMDAAKMAELKAPDKEGRALLRYVMGLKREDGKPIFQTCVSALGNINTFEENVGGVSPKVALLDSYQDPIAL